MYPKLVCEVSFFRSFWGYVLLKSIVCFFIELITVFVPVICQKSLFQSISLKVAISVPVVFTFVTISVHLVTISVLVLIE
ncbi:hypothetical protein HanIR_Chr08g0385281 [Helianthus annuus]|nr:hypothetical protein HanIR_Chr08g0385281 [Helianthus annuus]